MRNIGQGTIAGLLVVVATLLVINLAVIAPSQEAHADDDSSDDRGRRVEAVAFEVEGGGPDSQIIWRIFSDGTVERNRGVFVFFEPGCPELEEIEWCGWETVPE